MRFTLSATAVRFAVAAAGVITLSLGQPAAAEAPSTRLQNVQRTDGTVLVKGVDLANRKLTLASETGEEVTLDVPPEFKNFERLKVGDIIKATYVRDTVIEVSGRNARTPEDAATLVAARTSEGDAPSAVVGTKLVVTGAVLGVDMDKHTLQLVSPQGGEVVTVPVTRPEGQAAMAKLKPGDRVTATITEGLLLAVSPAN